MKKHIIIGMLATSFIITSCGSDPLAKKDPNSSDILLNNDIKTSDINSLNAGDIITAEIESRKNKEGMNADLKIAMGLLSEAAGLDAGSEQATIREKLTAATVIADKLAENDDFFLASEDLRNGVRDIEKKMSAYVAVGNIPVFMDLGSKFANITIKSLVKSGSSLYAIADKGLYGPLESGDLSKIVETTFPDGKYGQNGGYAAKFGALYITTNPSSVYAFNGKNLLEQKVKDRMPFAPAAQFTAYGSNLYFIDALNNKLIKYESMGNGTFGAPTNVLPEGALAGKAITGVAIDGSVYVLAFGESIKEYLKNTEVPLTIDRDYKGQNLTTRILTNLDSAYLYVFDPENKKLLRYKKGSGSLSIDKEYTLPGMYSGLYIAPGDKDGYLSDGNKIYKLGL